MLTGVLRLLLSGFIVCAPEDIVCGNAVKVGECDEVSDRKLTLSGLISGVLGLCGLEQFCDVGLLQVHVLTQVAQTL